MEAPEPGNSQSCLVVFNYDKFDQFFIAVEQKLMIDCNDLTTALCFLLGRHYILNLSYHSKLHDIMTFFQEKVAKIKICEILVSHVRSLFAEIGNFQIRKIYTEAIKFPNTKICTSGKKPTTSFNTLRDDTRCNRRNMVAYK